MTPRNRIDAKPFVTLDGSTIREIIHPKNTRGVKQSLAEATLPPHSATAEHTHKKSGEIYYVLEGAGWMHLGREEFPVRANDAIHIPAGTRHFIENISHKDIVFLCCSSPPYSDEDTVIYHER